MIKNYFKTAYRNLVKNKIYSVVNIFGLAVGMAACFFIFQYVNFESGYDRFNKNAANIYRVPISYSGSFSNIPMTAANHPALGPSMKNDFPEVLDYTRLVNISLFMNASTISYKAGGAAPIIFNEDNIFLADASFFNIFSYPLVSGNTATCLAEPKRVAISESSAKKYFGKNNPLGQTLMLNEEMPLKVSAVFSDVPGNSHIKFDMLISFSTNGPEWGHDNWALPEFYNYVLLAPGADVTKLEAKLPGFTEKYLGKAMKEQNFRSYFHLQPLTDIHLKSNYLKEAEANGSEQEVYFLSIVGAFILLIAWINFINLSTAKSMERAKEVGIRKVSGAIRGQLMVQFLLESFIINILALLLALLLISVCTPLFNHFIGKDISTVFFSSGAGANPLFWLIIGTAFVTGALLVGAYPSFVQSSFKPVKVLKGFTVKSNTGISVRRALVAFQFILSIVLIAATIIVFSQVNFMRNGKLGYKKEQVLIVKSPAIFDSTITGRYNFFKSELLSAPFVVNATATSDIPGNMIRYRNSVRRADQDKQHNFSTYLLEVDENFVKTYNTEMVAGKNFGLSDSSRIGPDNNNAKVLINEEIVKALGYKSSEEAVNKEIIFTLSTEDIRCRILGVMKNYHQRSLKEKYDPILYYIPSWVGWKYVSVNLNVVDLNKSIASIESMYNKAFPGNPFEYFFLDEFFNQQYQSDQRLGNVFGLFAVLAIMVASLGLLGLSSFVIKLRTKEIGIRKVLGASASGILMLISKDFVKLVCIASAIAVPITWWAAHEWLNNYAFRVNLSWLIFFIPPVVLLVIALITICLQSLKVALTNPVKSLRTE